ncbi:MAG TPA: Yip1 family protein [Blastocatellia bacterium]|nr:Yip1 family protein [Blastocatellia bacterium]
MSETQDQIETGAPAYAAPQSAPAAQPEESARMNAVQRFFGTIFSPGETFQDINRKPTWLVPLLICIVSSVAFMWFMFSHFDEGWHRFMQKAMADRAAQSGGPAPSGQDFEKIYTITRWGQTGGAGIFATIALFASAGVLALGMMLMQAKATFKKILSVVTWSWAVTGVLQLIVVIASVFVRGSDAQENFNPRDLGSMSLTNLAAFLPDDMSPFLKGIAATFDVFSIWFLILLMIGLATVSGLKKANPSKMAPMVLGLWFLTVLIRAAMAAAFAR